MTSAGYAAPPLGLKPTDLISEPYLETQRELHGRPKGYGGKGHKWAQAVADLVKAYGAWSVLDYGAGQGTLAVKVKELVPSAVRVTSYDPAVPEFRHWPCFADLVVSTDVLEHVEPERLNSVLKHIRGLARKAVFLVIATRPSNKTLTDGRNAHLILEQDEWWMERLLAAGFAVAPEKPVSPLLKRSRELVVVLTP
jgi:hypothetical protein